MSAIITEDIARIADDLKLLVPQLEGKTLLITGGAGFLGSYFLALFDHLNRTVLKTPCKVLSVDNFITGVKYRIAEGANFRAIQHNVKEPLHIDGPVDYLIHAAGIASPKFYRDFKIETIDVATMGTKNMLGLAKMKHTKSMIFFSSSEVYGDPDPKFVPTPETYNGNVSCIGPRANYDESKRLGETLCVTYYEVHGVPVKMIRPFNVYGPGMRMDDYRVIPNFVSHLFQGKPLPVYGGGNQTRTFCYISDAIAGFMRVLLSEHNAEPFNIGTEGPEITIEELAKIILELSDHTQGMQKGEGLNDAYTQGDPKRRCPDLSKARLLVGYHPKISLREGLQRFMIWAKDTHPELVHAKGAP